MAYPTFPDSYGRPDATLRVAYTAGSGLLQLDLCPPAVPLLGPHFHVKACATLFKVTSIGSLPYRDWTVEAAQGNPPTVDLDYGVGVPVFLEWTHADMAYLLGRSFITRDSEEMFSGGVALESLSLAELGTRHHDDLDDLNPNQHHPRFHRHDNVLDSTELTPQNLTVQHIFQLSGITEVPEITADQHNYFPTGSTTATCLVLTSDAAYDITGFVAGQVDGRMVKFLNAGSFNLTLKHDDSNSSVAVRFFNPGATDFVLVPGQWCWLFYWQEKWRPN